MTRHTRSHHRILCGIFAAMVVIGAWLAATPRAAAQDMPQLPPDHPPVPASASPRETFDEKRAAFARQIDLITLGQFAIHSEGRVKSFDSFARSLMQYVSGLRRINDQPHTFTYMDIMLRPMVYIDTAAVYVKNKDMRAQIAQALLHSSVEDFDESHAAAFMETGLISPRLLVDPAAQEVLRRMSEDVLRSARFVEQIEGALNVMHPEGLRMNLRFVAPPGGTVEDRWLTIDELADDRAIAAFPTLHSELRQQIITHWTSLTDAWRQGDAETVNRAIVELSHLLPQVNPELYPEQSRLAWESWYFRMRNLTWIWLFYAFAIPPLVLAIVFRWPAARWIGMGMFLLAFALHTFAVMLRWYVADRWPNSNMFEAITTAAWFGGCFAVPLELWLRRLPMRNLFAVGSAVASMTAMMAVHFMPLELNASINNMMPVLNDVWLYIHTNVIIFSYCLIFIAAVTAALYLMYRLVLAMRGMSGVSEYARVGGAGSLILTRPDGSTYLEEGKSTFGQVLDGTTMVLLELGFITLWAGLVMGAIWADHSWGRPWGWDPKEVFALNTFLVFLVLVHGRFKVKDKGLWTAVMALIGAVVMLFNWIIINFAISGLHSYA